MEPVTWKNLAASLEVSHQSLHLWRQLEGAPATADLEAWKAFKTERGLGRVRATGELNTLKAQLMLSQKLDLLLRLKLEVELGQRVIGKNAAEVNVEGGVILDEIREVINSNIALFQTDAVSWPRS
jgi:hypothetical protein